MEKGKRYEIGGTEKPWNGDAVEDPEGAWLYDPDEMYEKAFEGILMMQGQVVRMLDFLDVEKTAFSGLLSVLLAQWRTAEQKLIVAMEEDGDRSFERGQLTAIRVSLAGVYAIYKALNSRPPVVIDKPILDPNKGGSPE